MDWSGQSAGRSRALLLRARCAEVLDDVSGARGFAEAGFELASNPRRPLDLIEARLILGRLAMRAGRVPSGCDEADQHLAAALSLAEQCAAPWEIARARIACAQCRIAVGEAEVAHELLDSARSIAARLEARPLLERIAAIGDGARPAETVDAAPNGLSRRESEVLRLVARGLTNAEIATELFISPRTVEQHLRRIYDKLDIRSRSAATRFAIEHGIG
jgi:DNA-binding CsgD family transcriptional regulator